MTNETDIPLPVRFNPLKHHRDFISDILCGTSFELINSLPGSICNNYIDLYTGTMTPEAICNAVIIILQSRHVLKPDDFSRWIAEKKGYRTIKLEDRSEWIIRKSIDPERYIHIHPARTGNFTLRFKGSTLKTVYRLKAGFPGLHETPSLGDVNKIRLGIGLSPVKRLEQGKGIVHCWTCLF